MSSPAAAGPDGSSLVQMTIVGAVIAASSAPVTRFRPRTTGSCWHTICRMDRAKRSRA
jgi:hypothetical protein